jgi:hypothetical protein
MAGSSRARILPVALGFAALDCDPPPRSSEQLVMVSRSTHPVTSKNALLSWMVFTVVISVVSPSAVSAPAASTSTIHIDLPPYAIRSC